MASRFGMKIGVDLDNTLINFNRAFLVGAKELGLLPFDWQGNKMQIRDFLRSKTGGEIQWQNLQGQVYGRLIAHAHLFAGVYRFLFRCHQRGIIVDIVSHKTEYGHNDESKVPIRAAAIDFLANNGVTAGDNALLRKIYFESSREEKLQRIVINQYDWFIDDLEEILNDESLPNNLSRILFDESGLARMNTFETCHSWVEIEDRLLGTWTEPELRALAENVGGTPVASVNWVTRGGNAGLLEVMTEADEKYALKLYPVTVGHDRLRSEYNSFSEILKYNAGTIPLPFRCDRYLNAAMYTWIDGKVIDNPNSGHIRQALSFLEALHGIRLVPGFKSFQNASAALLSGLGFEEQLKKRVNFFVQFASEYSDLQNYLSDDFLPVMEDVIDWTRTKWKIQPAYNEILPRSQQTLSPSDFGFHNAIESQSGKLVFIDFEYFGWDDPVKLILDFLFHPAMELDSALKQQWIEGMLKIYGQGIQDRLRLAWPLIGLSWSLILLNEFRSEVWLRRCSANPDKFEHHKSILAAQLKRSNNMLMMINKHYKNPQLN